MEELKIIQGDLFSHSGNVLCHGVNCVGIFGKGIAVEFKRRWPDMFKDYHSKCKEGALILGDFHKWENNVPVYDADGWPREKIVNRIYNLAIKSHWRNPASYRAIESAVNLMLDDMVTNNQETVAMPWIGCGLGGLDKKHVAKILKRCLQKERQADKHLQIWVYEGK